MVVCTDTETTRHLWRASRREVEKMKKRTYPTADGLQTLATDGNPRRESAEAVGHCCSWQGIRAPRKHPPLVQALCEKEPAIASEVGRREAGRAGLSWIVCMCVLNGGGCAGWRQVVGTQGRKSGAASEDEVAQLAFETLGHLTQVPEVVEAKRS